MEVVTSNKRTSTTTQEKTGSKVAKCSSVVSRVKREVEVEVEMMSENTTSCTSSGGSSNLSPVSSPECFGCRKVIKERFLLQAVDHLWHEDCLKCACCDCRLGEVGSTLFTKANLILCKRDYLR